MGVDNKKIKMFTEENAKHAVLKVAEKHGTGLAQVVEKIYRAETKHFKSTQFQLTGSAGMESGKWFGLPSNVTTKDFIDNHDGHNGHFIVWQSCDDFAEYLAQYILRHEGNYACWNSLNPAIQDHYRVLIESVKARFC